MSWKFGRGTYVGATYIVSNEAGAFLHYTAGQRYGGGETGIIIRMGASDLEVGYSQRRNDTGAILQLTEGLEGFWWTGQPNAEQFFASEQPSAGHASRSRTERTAPALHVPVAADKKAASPPNSPLDTAVSELCKTYRFYRGESRTLLARRSAGDGFPDKWIGFDDLTTVNSTFALLRSRAEEFGKALETALLRHATELETVRLDVSQRYDSVRQSDGRCSLVRNGQHVPVEGTGYVSFNLLKLVHGRSGSGLHAGWTMGRATTVLGVLPGSDDCFWMPSHPGKVVFTGPEGKTYQFVFAIQYNTGVSLTPVKAVKHGTEVNVTVTEASVPQYYLFPAKNRALKLPGV